MSFSFCNNCCVWAIQWQLERAFPPSNNENFPLSNNENFPPSNNENWNEVWNWNWHFNLVFDIDIDTVTHNQTLRWHNKVSVLSTPPTKTCYMFILRLESCQKYFQENFAFWGRVNPYSLPFWKKALLIQLEAIQEWQMM